MACDGIYVDHGPQILNKINHNPANYVLTLVACGLHYQFVCSYSIEGFLISETNNYLDLILEDDD